MCVLSHTGETYGSAIRHVRSRRKEKTKNVKKLWIAVLLGMLLVLSLAGETGARDRAAVSARKYVTIAGGHFQPIQDGCDWWNNGNFVKLSSSASPITDFVAPVVFPGSGPVIVRKITLYADDNVAIHDVVVSLYKLNPAGGTGIEMASASSAGNALGIREFSDTSITYATIQRTHGVYLYLSFDASSSLLVTGVKIAYTD